MQATAQQEAGAVATKGWGEGRAPVRPCGGGDDEAGLDFGGGNTLSEAPRRVTSVQAQPATLFALTNFTGLGLSGDFVAALAAMHVVTPTVIQARAIPAVFSGYDVVVGSATGSGILLYVLRVVQQLKQAEALNSTRPTRWCCTTTS